MGKKKRKGEAGKSPASMDAKHDQMQICIDGELALLEWEPVNLRLKSRAGNTGNVWRFKHKKVNKGRPVELPRYGSSNYYIPENLYVFNDAGVIAQVGFSDSFVTVPVVLFTSFRRGLFPSLGPFYFMPHRSTLKNGYPANPIAALIHLMDDINLDAFTVKESARWDNNIESQYEKAIVFDNQGIKFKLQAQGLVGKDEVKYI